MSGSYSIRKESTLSNISELSESIKTQDSNNIIMDHSIYRTVKVWHRMMQTIAQNWKQMAPMVILHTVSK